MKIKFDKKYGLIAFALFDAMVLLSFVVIDSELNRNAGVILFVGFVYCISQAFFNLEKNSRLGGRLLWAFCWNFRSFRTGRKKWELQTVLYLKTCWTVSLILIISGWSQQVVPLSGCSNFMTMTVRLRKRNSLVFNFQTNKVYQTF